MSAHTLTEDQHIALSRCVEKAIEWHKDKGWTEPGWVAAAAITLNEMKPVPPLSVLIDRWHKAPRDQSAFHELWAALDHHQRTVRRVYRLDPAGPTYRAEMRPVTLDQDVPVIEVSLRTT